MIDWFKVETGGHHAHKEQICGFLAEHGGMLFDRGNGDGGDLCFKDIRESGYADFFGDGDMVFEESKLASQSQGIAETADDFGTILLLNELICGCLTALHIGDGGKKPFVTDFQSCFVH